MTSRQNHALIIPVRTGLHVGQASRRRSAIANRLRSNTRLQAWPTSCRGTLIYANNKVLKGINEGWKLEAKARFKQPPRNDAAAFEEEFGLGAHKKGPDFQHPFTGGQTERRATDLAQEPQIGRA